MLRLGLLFRLVFRAVALAAMRRSCQIITLESRCTRGLSVFTRCVPLQLRRYLVTRILPMRLFPEWPVLFSATRLARRAVTLA